jgi:myo-inositol-1(or 4)-monophosphatase
MGSGVTAAAAATLNLAHQADGRLDGGVALDTKLWDIAAAAHRRESGVFLGGEGGTFPPG